MKSKVKLTWIQTSKYAKTNWIPAQNTNFLHRTKYTLRAFAHFIHQYTGYSLSPSENMLFTPGFIQT